MDIDGGPWAMYSVVMLGMIAVALALALTVIRGSDERLGR